MWGDFPPCLITHGCGEKTPMAEKMVRNPIEHIVHYLLRGASTTWFIGDCPTKQKGF